VRFTIGGGRMRVKWNVLVEFVLWTQVLP